MNVFQRCPSTSELEPLYLPQRLYLRPHARLNISIQLPNVSKMGKSVSHWEIMDRLKELIKPEEFTILKVTNTTVEFVRFEAEVEKKSKLGKVVDKVHNKMIKLKGFADLMRVKASETKSDFPNRRVWDAFFSEAKNMDEMKPGERPDTIHLSNLPTKWFRLHQSSRDHDEAPSEKVFYRVFEKFGPIRNVDIPTCDPYRKKMKDHISGLKYSSFDNMDMFEGYIQFKDYIGFTKAMDFFRDKKLVREDDDGYTELDIRVDFDKTKHLSDASIRRREIVRDRLVKKSRVQEEKDKKLLEEKRRQDEAEKTKEDNLKNQKEIRRRVREEKRKAKILKELEVSGSDEINQKIAREEKKLLKAQRKLEAIRLVEELFRRIKDKNYGNIQTYDVPDPKGDELRRLKNVRELDYLSQKEKLHHAVKGRVVLRSILADKHRTEQLSESSDSELSLVENSDDRRVKVPLRNQHPADMMFDGHPPPMYTFPYQPMYPPFGTPMFPEIDIYGIYRGRGRGRGRGRRGQNSRGRNMQPYQDHYYNRNRRNEHDNRYRSRSYSPRRNSYSRSRSRSYSRRRRSRSRSIRRERYSSRSRSRSHRRSRSRSRKRAHSSKSRRSRSRSKQRSRSRSVDSSKFMTPQQFAERKKKTRSKSWSLPKEDTTKSKSWSATPEKVQNA